MPVTLDPRELATVLAALRLLQLNTWLPNDIEDIATNSGEFTPLDVVEIDALCERLNT